MDKNFFEKNIPIVFACIKNVVSLQRQNKNNGLWCNGNTTDSGPVILGSNPGSPAKKEAVFQREDSLFRYKPLPPARSAAAASPAKAGSSAQKGQGFHLKKHNT